MDDRSSAVAVLPVLSVSQRILRLQILTVLWMSIEAIIALTTGWSAKSSALLGFGGDSAVELLSAIVVLWRFRSKSDSTEKDEKLAARVAGALLLVVAGFVILSAGLSLFGYRESRPTVAGIALLIAAAIGMPWLASQKRKLAIQVASASLRADATESALCGYLSLIALGGLLANAIFHVRWADPVAGLALVPLITREAWLAIRTSRHCCA